MDIHGYPAKNGLDMDAIFHLHGKPAYTSQVCQWITVYMI